MRKFCEPLNSPLFQLLPQLDDDQVFSYFNLSEAARAASRTRNLFTRGRNCAEAAKNTLEPNPKSMHEGGDCCTKVGGALPPSVKLSDCGGGGDALKFCHKRRGHRPPARQRAADCPPSLPWVAQCNNFFLQSGIIAAWSACDLIYIQSSHSSTNF